MKVRREEYRCPICSQTCSRRWNLMIHIDRRHPEIGGAANPLRQQRDSARFPNYADWNGISDLSTTPLGRKYQRIRHILDGDQYPGTLRSSAMYFDNLSTEAWLNWRRGRQEEQAIKRRENERNRFHQQLEDYRAALRIREIQNRKGMGGNSNVEIMNYISRQLSAGRLTAIESIDQDGIIMIRYELNNKKDGVRPNVVDGNGLTGHQLQEILTILAAQSEFNYNFIKLMEARKHNLDVTVDELVQLFAGGIKASQANNPTAEQSRIEEKPKVVSGILSRVEEKTDYRYDGQEEKTSQKEIEKVDFADLCSSNCEMSPHMTPPLARPLPTDRAWFHSESPASHKSSKELEPLEKKNGQELKLGGRPDECSSALPRPHEHFGSSHGYGAQQGPPTDEEIKKEIEEAARTQIWRIQKDRAEKPT